MKLKEWLDVTVVVAGALIAFVAIGNLIVGLRVSTLQSEKDKAISQRQAEAELKLKRITERQEPRRLPFDTFVQALKGKPTAKVEIMYQPEDPEAHMLAEELAVALRNAGWGVSFPKPIPPDTVSEGLRGAPSELLRRFPSVTRVGAQPSGISIVTNLIEGPPYEKETPFGALTEAFLASGFGIGAGLDRNLSDNVLRLVVGPKP